MRYQITKIRNGLWRLEWANGSFSEHSTQDGAERMALLNAGTGRRLTPEESAEKTKDWPKYDGKTMAESAAEAQRAGYGHSNLPPGITQEDLDNR